jgi:hypothetical protein
MTDELRPTTPHTGPDGNERLTAAVGLILIGLAALELATLLFGLQTTLRLHVLVGLALLPPIALKLASTGWRFVRYYAGSEAYRAKGAPELPMRMLAPFLVAFTVLLFGSGVAMGVLHGHALEVARRIHGPAAVGWMLTLGAHVLVYTPRAMRAVGGDLRGRTRVQADGAQLRAYVIAAAVTGVLIVALATLPVQHLWLHLPSRHHHAHGHVRAA